MLAAVFAKGGVPMFNNYVSPEVHQELTAKCQENIWLMHGGVMFEDDPWAEDDYDYSFPIAEDIPQMEAFFAHGNWAIRQGVVYGNLAFINQVNGGDEWWTLKKFDSGWLAFESMTMRLIIRDGEFSDTIGKLMRATYEQCETLTYAQKDKPE